MCILTDHCNDYMCVCWCVCVCVNSELTLAGMTSRKKGAVGGNIEEVLRNTLRVLCSNAVPYGTQISIDAMVGITINNSEVILVNMHEQLDKSDTQASSDEGGSVFGQGPVKSEPFDGMVTASQHHQQSDNFNTTAADSSEYAFSSYVAYENAEFGSSARQFSGDVVNVSEADDDGDEHDYYESCDMEEGDYPDDYAAGECGDEYLNDFDTAGTDAADGGLYSAELKPFNMVAFGSGGDSLRMSKAVLLSSSRRRGKHGAAQMSGSRKKPSTPRRQPKASMKTELGETSQNVRSVSAEKITVYTCSVCGSMFRHAGSFQRHKQQHEGVVFRCDLCGAVLSRRDVLNAHRRKCEAKLMQQPSSDQFNTM